MNARIYCLLIASLLMLHGCGGSSSGADVQANLPPSAEGGIVYEGPAPRTSDVSAFKLNLWDNLADSARCGACHADGGQAPAFVQRNDINLAYNAANTVVNLTNPGGSIMVSKVAGGHNCWLSEDSACAALIETWITNWANASIGGEAGTLELTPPAEREAGTTRGYPASSSLFATHVYPLFSNFCVDCHQPSATTPVTPYFAHTDVDTAYLAAQGVMNLDDPGLSRVVQRLAEDNHNCWTESCDDDADAMTSAIAAMAAGIPLTPPDAALVISDALLLNDGSPVAGGGRFDANLVARYEFRTGSGNTAFDTSGVEPALNLTLSGDTEWVGGWGIRLDGGRAQGSTQTSSKLRDLIIGSGEFSIEAWLIPSTPGQMDAHIISYSAGTENRNVTLAQQQASYQAQLRNDNTDANGMPPLDSPMDSLQATLQHVVLTYNAENGRRLYINGVDSGAVDPVGPTLLNSWSDNYALILGNEASGDRPWQGVLRFVAIHNRALSAEQIGQNFSAGVGERFYLLFGISDVIDVPGSYIGFLVSRFDNYSYLFAEPFFINLDDGVTSVPAIDLEGMRIGLNGRELSVAQAWTNLDTVIGGGSYDGALQALSPLGTVIPVERGQEQDEFFLTFARLGDETHAYSDPGSTPIVLEAGPEQSDIGLRTFDEINASMSAMTGISPTHPEVIATFDNVRQQLPVSEDPGGFLTAHQIGVAQLAIEYCNALVEEELDANPAASAFFPGLDYTDNANDISDGDWRTLVIEPMVARALGVGLDSQPVAADVENELADLLLSIADNKPVDEPDGLPDGLARCGGACPGDQTAISVKAACAASLASATMLLQ